MKLYVISINDAQNRMHSYGIVASTLANALAEAQRLAGVGASAEPASTQMLHTVDSVVA
jgi:hypothetical protein